MTIPCSIAIYVVGVYTQCIPQPFCTCACSAAPALRPQARRCYPNRACRGVVELARVGREFFNCDMGLKKLASRLLGYTIRKGKHTGTWELPPYTPAQLRYACEDAWLSREIALIVQLLLQLEGRSIADGIAGAVLPLTWLPGAAPGGVGNSCRPQPAHAQLSGGKAPRCHLHLIDLEDSLRTAVRRRLEGLECTACLCRDWTLTTPHLATGGSIRCASCGITERVSAEALRRQEFKLEVVRQACSDGGGDAGGFATPAKSTTAAAAGAHWQDAGVSVEETPTQSPFRQQPPDRTRRTAAGALVKSAGRAEHVPPPARAGPRCKAARAQAWPGPGAHAPGNAR